MKKSHYRKKDSFTLIELLIVIAIIAILGAAVVVVLNPVEMMAQARDSQRVTDTENISKSIDLLSISNSPSLGTYRNVYISIPSATAPNCDAVGLPALPTGWSYVCSNATDYRDIDGTGWIPLNLTTIENGNPITSLPIDPVNNSSSFYSYIPSNSSTYAITGPLESIKHKILNQNSIFSTKITYGTAPNLVSVAQGGDWVKVPGNSAYGTSDFQVMKYEAKCVDSNGSPLFSPTESSYKTYYNSNALCTAANNRYISSRKDGYVITRISRGDAKTYCASIGAHLMTNEEWMTIARNAEQQSSNWSGESVGSGYLFSGHNDGVPARALQVSTDSNGYADTGNTSGNQRRTLTLSNGEIIWDMAGNIWEYVQRTSADVITTIDLPACSDGQAAWGFCQYGSSTTPYVSSWAAAVPNPTQSYVGPSNILWNSSNGMGEVITFKNGTDQGTSFFSRGGGWWYGSSVGIYTVEMSAAASDVSVDFGFRCAK